MLQYLTQPIGVIPRLIAGMRNLCGAREGLFDMIDTPIEPKRGNKSIINKESVEHAIEFEKVMFEYRNSMNVLHNLNFKIPYNKMTAVVGASGSGKSTILNILCGFYKIKNGSIKVYGRDIIEWDLKTLRSQIAIVSQDTYLFSGTIMSNIVYGNNNASKEEIINAAKEANAHNFIIKLPNGYDTIVGESGCQLSGGQRQLIALARAILKRAPILILDEATSALDGQLEMMVLVTLKELLKKCTILVIAHRISTIKMQMKY